MIYIGLARFGCLAALGLCLLFPVPVSAGDLLDKIKEGASEVGQAVGNTAEDIGHAVGDTVDSTVEMVSNEETPAQTRARLDAVAEDTVSVLLAENPQADELFAKSYGYAAFDMRQATLVGATAGYGRGVAVDKTTGQRTYMKMGTGGVGLAFGIGGFERKLVILFETADVFIDFIEHGYDATAKASAMVGDDNEREQAQFVEGRSLFYLSKKGWRVATSATGTKYWKDADLN